MLWQLVGHKKDLERTVFVFDDSEMLVADLVKLNRAKGWEVAVYPAQPDGYPFPPPPEALPDSLLSGVWAQLDQQWRQHQEHLAE